MSTRPKLTHSRFANSQGEDSCYLRFEGADIMVAENVRNGNSFAASPDTARDICTAYNATHAAGINPAAVKPTFDYLIHLIEECKIEQEMPHVAEQLKLAIAKSREGMQ